MVEQRGTWRADSCDCRMPKYVLGHNLIHNAGALLDRDGRHKSILRDHGGVILYEAFHNVERRATSTRAKLLRRHARLQLLEPIEDDDDAGRRRFLIAIKVLDRQESLAIG